MNQQPILLALCLSLLGNSYAARKIETVAGTGKPGFSGDGGPALKAELNNPYGLAVGPGGALFVCDMGNDRVRRIDANGIITTVAGSGSKGWIGDGGPATAAALNEPYEVRFDRHGNMFFVEMRNAVVRRVDAKTGMISTIAGSGRPGFEGDGGAATNAMLNQPHSIQFVNDQRELWICDIGNNRIRSVNMETGMISTVGGTGEAKASREGEFLMGNPLKGPRALDVDRLGNVWLALREGNAIYSISARDRKIHRVAGNGSAGFAGNGGPALDATLSGPKGITVFKSGISLEMVIWTDTESHTIRYYDQNKRTVELLVGTGNRGDGPDGDPLKCELSRPHGVFLDSNANLWIGDSENHRVRKLNLR